MKSIARRDGNDEREPSAVELAAIEAEWPQIEADLAELDAEIAEIERVDQLAEIERGWPAVRARLTYLDRLDELDWRRRRRAERRLLGVRPDGRGWQAVA